MRARIARRRAPIVNEQDIAPEPMPRAEGRWAATRFVDAEDLRHNMHVTIVTFAPGAVIPFAETHVMEQDVNRHPKLSLKGCGRPMPRSIPVELLTGQAFAPFGEVIEADHVRSQRPPPVFPAT